jgi:hypothetical protein
MKQSVKEPKPKILLKKYLIDILHFSLGRITVLSDCKNFKAGLQRMKSVSRKL